MRYWGELQENAIIDFNTNDNTDSKHKVYNDVILPAFLKLIENIYYTYNFNKILFDYNKLDMRRWPTYMRSWANLILALALNLFLILAPLLRIG